MMASSGKLHMLEVQWTDGTSGRTRSNLGAQVAFNEGATHVCFPNDYQHFAINPDECLQHLLPADDVSIGIGVLVDQDDRRALSPIWSSGPVSAKSPWLQRRGAWGSALEALMVCSSGLFEATGGWNTRIATGLHDEISPSGDGLELLFRCLENGGCVYPVPGYEVAGGHRFPELALSISKFRDYGRGTIRIETYLGFPWWYKALHTAIATIRGTGLKPKDPRIYGSAEEWRARAHGMRSEFISQYRRRYSSKV